MVHVRDEKDLNLTLNTFLQNWTDKLQIPRAMVYKIYVANFTFSGYNFTQHRDAIVTLISAKISDDPDRSCALVIPPNTGPYRSAYDIGAAETSTKDLFDLLRDPSFDMAVQDCSIFWEPASMWSRSKKFRQEIFMCISKQRLPVPGSSGVNPDKESSGVSGVVADVEGGGSAYKSAFARSKFFIRGSTGEFCPVMPRSQCVDPTSRISVADRGNMSHAQELKQWASGPLLWAQVAEAIWSGLDVSNSDGAAWVELLGYDHFLQCAMMQRAGVMAIDAPREMAGSIIWTLGQNEGKQRKTT